MSPCSCTLLSRLVKEIPFYYLVPRASEEDAIRALRALDVFVRTPGGRVRLDDPDRVVVWRDGADLYVSPGAFSLAGYLEPNPDMLRSPDLCGPEMTTTGVYPGPAMIASATIPAAELPSSSVLMLGAP
jgi:hypothetical protein